MAPAGEWRDTVPMSASGRYAVEDSGGLDLAQILSIGRRRWKWMLGAFAVCVAFAMFSVWRSKPVYQAMATLEMTPNNQQGVPAPIPGLERFYSNNQSRNLDTQLEILKGGPIRQRAYKTLKPTSIERLNGSAVEAGQRGNTNLVDVVVRALDAQAAAEYANALSNAYVAASLEKNRNSSIGAVNYVQKQMDDVQTRLGEAQNKLSQFKKDKGVYSLTDAATQLTSSLSTKKTALEGAETQRAGVVAQLQKEEAQLRGIPANRLVATGIQKNPVITTLQSQLTAKEIERSTLTSEYTESSQRVRGIDAEIASLRSQLSKQAKTEVTSMVPDPRREPLSASVAASQSQIWALDATIEALRQQIGGTQARVNQLPDQEFEYAQLVSRVELEDAAYKQFAQTLSTLKVAQGSQTSDARLSSSATPNYGPIAPDKRRIILTGIVMGLLSALALAMLVDGLDNRVYNEEDVQKATHLPVLAQLPFVKKTDMQNLYLTGESISPLLESNRMLRANISFCATDRPIKAVVVTSSMPNEGKSTSALNLAVAAALSGETVILIDLDLRRPTQHVLTGLPNTSGFTNVIAGQVDLESALQETLIPNLRILTSGPTPPNPFKMLNSHVAKATIEQLISMAQFVVIDTPPVLGLADARLISSLVDGTLMVVASQQTGRREAARAADLMASANQEVLGTVLTKVPNNANGYGSYHAYHKYGRYFDENQSTTDKMDEAALAGKLGPSPQDKKM